MLMAIVQATPAPPLILAPQLIVSSCGAADSGASHLHRVHVPAGADHQLAGRGEAVRQQGCRRGGLGQSGSYLLPQTAAGHWLLPCKPSLESASMPYCVSWERSEGAQCVSTGPVQRLDMLVKTKSCQHAVEKALQNNTCCYYGRPCGLHHKLLVSLMLQARLVPAVPDAIIASEAQSACGCLHVQ